MGPETYVTILHFTPGIKTLKRNINICLSDKVSQGVSMTPENICLLGKASLDVPK